MTIVAGVNVGDVLVGKYRVERITGAGGMGVVVSAHHLAHLSAAAAVGALCLTLCAPAHAQGTPADSASAQALFDQAKKLMAKGNYAEACPKLEESQRLDPASGTLLNLGDCYEHEGKAATAWAKFLEAAAVAKAAGNAGREQVSRERAASVSSKVSYILINVAAASAPIGFELKRDGSVVGKAQWGTAMPADPGKHTLSATAPGRKPWETTIAVGAFGQTVTISVPPLASANPSAEPIAANSSAQTPLTSTDEATRETGGLGTQRLIALGLGGIGVAGLAIGTAFGLKSKAKHDEAAQTCNPGCDDESGLGLKADAQQAGNISTAAFIVGVAGAVGAAALWFTAPSAGDRPPTRPSASQVPSSLRFGISPGGIVLGGAF